jgi:hypothetical protein
MNIPDPKAVAEHLKELGPDKVAATLIAAYGALCATMPGGDVEVVAKPAQPKTMDAAAAAVADSTNKGAQSNGW